MELKIARKTIFFKNDFTGKNRQFNNKSISAVEIEIEELELNIKEMGTIILERPILVKGIILPLTTKCRKKAPDPVAYSTLIRYIKSIPLNRRFRILSPNSDRGHIIALELGGPNSKYNIIPQWSGFQEYGDWRRIERKFKNDATILKQNDNSLFLEIDIEYLNLKMNDLQTKLEPIFSIKNKVSLTEERIKKVLQIFGIPISYSFQSCPCNIFLKKPRKHSLSISYVKYLYEVAQEIYNDNNKISINTKIRNSIKKINKGWANKKLSLNNFLHYDEKIFRQNHDFLHEGRLVFSEITEEDL